MKTALVERTVDLSTGEVVSETATSTITEADDEPDYVKLYVSAWVAFKNVKGVNTSLVVQLLPFMAYADKRQVLFLNSAVKRMIARRLGWSEPTALKRFAAELRKLENAKILIHADRDMWVVNPELVGRGSWRDIRQLRATFNVIGPGAGGVDVETGM